MRKVVQLFLGAAAGFLNGLLGAGGALVMVPVLKYQGLEQQEAQATAMSAALAMAGVSVLIYGIAADLPQGWFWVPVAMTVGSLIGARMMGLMKARLLGRLFALIMAVSGIRMLIA